MSGRRHFLRMGCTRNGRDTYFDRFAYADRIEGDEVLWLGCSRHDKEPSVPPTNDDASVFVKLRRSDARRLRDYLDAYLQERPTKAKKGARK